MSSDGMQRLVESDVLTASDNRLLVGGSDIPSESRFLFRV